MITILKVKQITVLSKQTFIANISKIYPELSQNLVLLPKVHIIFISQKSEIIQLQCYIYYVYADFHQTKTKS